MSFSCQFALGSQVWLWKCVGSNLSAFVVSDALGFKGPGLISAATGHTGLAHNIK